jgi:hypothetical protein
MEFVDEAARDSSMRRPPVTDRVDAPIPEGGPVPLEEEHMRRKLLWALLALGMSAPAVWAGTKAFGSQCPVPCDDCPLARR